MNHRLRNILSWILVMIWCMSIFYFSHEHGKDSHGRSEQIVKKVETAITRVVEREDKMRFEKELLEYVVRKTAHVSEYLILTILVYVALKHSGLKGYKRYIGAALFAVMYACLDEGHQVFVSGRDGRVKDVFIDSIGVMIGYMICCMASRVRGCYRKYRYS